MPVALFSLAKLQGEAGETEVLPLGLYLVLETETPDSVRTACEPFFVSVPMTKVSDDANGGLIRTYKRLLADYRKRPTTG